jgi:hypothetical protein
MSHEYKKVYFKNCIEYVLKQYHNLTNEEFNVDTMELFFENEDRERTIINELSYYRECFNTVYQGMKNYKNWYKISVKDMQKLEEFYTNWKWTLIKIV